MSCETSWPACTREGVDAIIETGDDELRNLAITLSYHRLTRAVGRRLGGRDIPWTGFAVWASKTAGMFIRRDWVPERLYALATRVDPTGERLAALDGKLKLHVARGNRAVYAEIGPLFVELIHILDAPPARRDSMLADLVATLEPGPVESGGQEPLAAALRAYVEAASCGDDRERAERVLLANIWIGYQEQWRLQPEIQGSLDSPVTLLPAPRGWLHRRANRALASSLRRAMTRFMIIATPEAPLRLGRDIPPLDSGQMFPRALSRLRWAPLRELVGQVDRTPDTTDGSAARDWASFDDRMNFLVDLFRSHQRVPDLWAPPFSRAQIAALERGELPPGRL